MIILYASTNIIINHQVPVMMVVLKFTKRFNVLATCNTRGAIYYAPFMDRALHVQLTNCMHSNRILPQPKP